MTRLYRRLSRRERRPQVTINVLESTYQKLVKDKSHNQPLYDVVDKKLIQAEEVNVLRLQVEKQEKVIGKEYDLKQEYKIRIEELEKEVSKLRQDMLRLQSMIYPRNSFVY